jgi:hypothetical protein
MQKSLTLALVLIALSPLACSGAGNSDTPSTERPSTADASTENASTSSAASVDGSSQSVIHATASDKTYADTGIALWEIDEIDAQYVVTGRSPTSTTIVAFRVSIDPGACVDGGDAGPSGSDAATVQRTDSGLGTQTLDCTGSVRSSSFDAETQTAWNDLSNDANGTATARTAHGIVTADFYCPSYFCGCEIKTDISCYGVVEICRNHYANCSTSNRYVCGACFFFTWW